MTFIDIKTIVKRILQDLSAIVRNGYKEDDYFNLQFNFSTKTLIQTAELLLNLIAKGVA